MYKTTGYPYDAAVQASSRRRRAERWAQRRERLRAVFRRVSVAQA
jgi:hypothetical protein